MISKRIRDIALQCNAWDQVYNNKQFMIDRTFNVEKFAELIINECAVIADQERPRELGCGYITKTKGQQIKEHFGVEE